MTKRKKKPKTISRAKAWKLVKEFHAIASASFRASRKTDQAPFKQYWDGRGHAFEYCAIVIWQELLRRSK